MDNIVVLNTTPWKQYALIDMDTAGKLDQLSRLDDTRHLKYGICAIYRTDEKPHTQTLEEYFTKKDPLFGQAIAQFYLSQITLEDIYQRMADYFKV
jgi:hypothetical protein